MKRSAREGYLYVSVLLVTLLISAVVAGMLTTSVVRARMSQQKRDYEVALAIAKGELQRQLALAADNATWRASFLDESFSAFQSVTWASATSGQVRIRAEEDDDSFTDNLADPVTLTVHAVVGQSEVAIQAILDPLLETHPQLRYNIKCMDDLTLNNYAFLSSQNGVHASDDVQANTGTLLTASLIHAGDGISSNTRGDEANVAVPATTADLLSLYGAGGIAIDETDLIVDGSNRRLEEQVLTDNYNPFGTAGPVYVIDIPGHDLVIEDCRIEATLVVLNANRIVIREGILWEPSAQSNVILVTDEPIAIHDWRAEFSEAYESANFNPPGAPYRGNSDTSNDDTYASALRGLIATTSDIFVRNRLDFPPVIMAGHWMCDDFQTQTDLVCEPMDELLLFPPVGFQVTRNMVIRPRSYRIIASP